VGGWNPDQGRAVLGTSRGDAPGPGGGQTGAQILRQAIAERPHHIGHLAVGTDDEAQAAAAVAFDQRARRFVVVEGCAEGNPALRVGTHVTLTGLGPRFENTYYVIRACHRYDLHQGYETEFEAESAFWGGR
jgi:phage protein D